MKWVLKDLPDDLMDEERIIIASGSIETIG
jgi:hypothetical protein